MKKVFIAMVAMFVLTIWPFSGVWQLLKYIIGGGAQESFLYPIYGGIILLAGLIVLCAEVIIEELRELKKELKKD